MTSGVDTLVKLPGACDKWKEAEQDDEDSHFQLRAAVRNTLCPGQRRVSRGIPYWPSDSGAHATRHMTPVTTVRPTITQKQKPPYGGFVSFGVDGVPTGIRTPVSTVNLLEGDSGGGGVRATTNALNSLTDALNNPDVKSGLDSIASGIGNIVAQSIEGIGALARLQQNLSTLSGIRDKGGFNANPAALNNRELDVQLSMLSRGKSKAKAAGDTEGVARIQGKITALIRENTNRLRKQLAVDAVGQAFDDMEMAMQSAKTAPGPPKAGKTGKTSKTGGGKSKRAVPDFMPDADAVRRAIEEVVQARDAFDSLAATLAGPLAEAQFRHIKAMEEIEALGKKSEVSSEQITTAKTLETKRYQQQRREIERSLDPMGELLDNMRFELDVIGKSNAERAVMNQLRAQGIDLMDAEAQRALNTAKAYAEQGERQMQVIDLMDSFRSGASDALTDIVTGAKSAKDALTDFFDSIAAQITRAIADNWMAKLFGSQGSSGGTNGGDWISAMLGKLFGGANANGNAFAGGSVIPFANGGVVSSPSMFPMSGGRMGLMGERGPEAIMPLTRGNDGRLGVTAQGGKNITINTQVNVPQSYSYQTAEQIARSNGQAVQRAMRRSS